ncbi:MAG: DUF362 domain-containing protein [Deltaproteobacteria bacterium]|nr:DUF362 domain-containing protein [Candidatus Zymogenaceae bacterium]
MEKPNVAVVTYAKPIESLQKAIRLADGFNNLKKNDRVLIKPNALTWDNKHHIPPYGVFTSTRLVEDLVIALKEFGCTDIFIGEGAVQLNEDAPTSIGVMENLGYGALVAKYGVKLIDLNDGPFEKVKLADDLTLFISEPALKADFLIDIPAMKTHSQTKVSLGMKNLKGCLKMASRRLCHHKDLDLDYCVSLIPEKLTPKLTIVDGIYVLEKGPIHTGNAYRADLIAVSTDIFAADVVATALMGLDPAEIGHLSRYAKRHGRSLSYRDFAMKGEDVETVKKPVKWDWNWNEANTGPTIFERMGITGVAIPKYDETLCTGCSPIVNMSNIFIISANKGKPFGNFEVLSGKRMLARPGYDKTLLLGNCIIAANKNNPNIKEAIELKGCPPSVEDLKKVLTDLGVEFVEGAYDYYLNQLATKYDGKEEYDKGLYTSA